MELVKSIAVLLCLVSVTINPVVSRLMPCCCTDRQEAKRPSCQTQLASSKSSPVRSCCKTDKQTTVSDSAIRSDCSCVKPLPASVPVKSVKIIVQHSPFEASAWPPLADEFLGDGLAYLRNHCSRQFRLSGPPLLALHCTWLK